MPDTRQRMIEATVAALASNGVAGMSFTEVLRNSGAARGAIYHHFPKGKGQLVTEAAALHADRVSVALSSLPTDSPLHVVEAFLSLIRPVLAESAVGSGCAVAAVTIGAPDLDPGPGREVAAQAFAGWTATLADALATAGLSGPQATATATTLIMLLEGAHVLCRAAGDLGPLDVVAASCRTLVT